MSLSRQEPGRCSISIPRYTPLQNITSQTMSMAERVGSLAGGALMISKGLRHGGLIGLLQSRGGLALARGVSGHCSTKAVVAKPRRRDRQ